MAHDDFNPHARDVRNLTPLQWTAMKRSIIRRAQDERSRAIRSIISCAVVLIRDGWRRLRERQDADAVLRAMSDYELHDIGLTRAGVAAAVRYGVYDAAPSASRPPNQTGER